ncbi:carbamoyltransferase HypF [Ammoniphilus sp. CFH 90114]|uniref:carbamoyltransferase HypF n=1 Tax=Ammoniphilus sp. CFH 90114 TaxID=2493665 RepID=UPI00100E7B50|nr:carbamoyltransferase HypF [Ammoniphilus sp. CFH 90114]RXT07955.1 carbamoyltransferase HypF [Ammoniphilus sp. CFH 90114]
MDQLARGSTSTVHEKERRRVEVSGIVQGVGFRPFVFRLAHAYHLKGYVRNDTGAVTIEVEGWTHQLDQFMQSLQYETKEPARIDTLSHVTLAPVGYQQFSICESKQGGLAFPPFPADLAVCQSCLSEILNPQHRLFHYPFTSCTHCGPRYSIIHHLPYDRKDTTMHAFKLCPSCERDYTDPNERRFHAQTLCCPDCGPLVQVRIYEHTPIEGDWIRIAQQSLLRGEIMAVKGIGGFHLLCDATQPEAIKKLRVRKHRVRKPFALMVRNLATLEKYFVINMTERNLLQDRRASIVLLRPKPLLRKYLDVSILADGYARIGVMLPYTPLHTLLFSTSLSFLIATSGNLHGQTIVRTNKEAFHHLRGMADLFVVHSREIKIRVEDSVCQVIDNQVQVLRRSRGYVPEAIKIPKPKEMTEELVILAAGAEKKNTFCIIKGDQAIMSQHMGDLDTKEQMEVWKEGVHHMLQLLGTNPSITAYDPHPRYQITQEFREANQGKTCFPVYHHHAHMAACMAEHGLEHPVIGCILDGTGYGRDGGLWGFEILTGDYVDFQRICSLQELPLPGGEAAIRQPWIQAVSLFYEGMQDFDSTKCWAEQQFPMFKEKLSLVLAQLQGKVTTLRTTSAGRLFDGVSAMLGICLQSSYEGEAAILLGEKAENSIHTKGDEGYYSFELKERQLFIRSIVREVLIDIDKRTPHATIARKFHHTVAHMVCAGAKLAREEKGYPDVVLSGGVWHNRYLLSYTKGLLEQEGFKVYIPQVVPAGDGGIALGQAVCALWRWQRDVSIGTRQDS